MIPASSVFGRSTFAHILIAAAGLFCGGFVTLIAALLFGLIPFIC